MTSPATKFRYGDTRFDGFRFMGYGSPYTSIKTGDTYRREVWVTPERFEQTRAQNLILSREYRRTHPKPPKPRAPAWRTSAMQDTTLQQGHVGEDGRVFLGYTSRQRTHGRWGTLEELETKRAECRKYVAANYARRVALRPPKPVRVPVVKPAPRVLLTPEQKKARIPLYKKKYRKKLRSRLRVDPVLRAHHNTGSKMGSFLKKRRSAGSLGMGCSREFFMQYFSQLFGADMTWDNYGSAWHVDHIVPRSWFKKAPPSYRVVLNHFSNLRPLSGAENSARADWMSVEDFSLALRRAPDEHRDWIHHLAQLNADKLEKRGPDLQPIQGPVVSSSNHQVVKSCTD